ncbi:MAG TPA: replication initiation protein [Terriglobia bacterium]|nr:replication initiation protein [Terriglobia bacterium]
MSYPRYPIYRDLNARVLKPAVLEVNEISDVECSIEPIAEGRKTTGLRLAWRKKGSDDAVSGKQAQTQRPARKFAPALRVVGKEAIESESPKTANRLRALNTRECEQLRKTFDGYDIYYFYSEFQDWLERTGGEIPGKPAAAFTNWLKNYYKITGPLRQ